MDFDFGYALVGTIMCGIVVALILIGMSVYRNRNFYAQWYAEHNSEIRRAERRQAKAHRRTLKGRRRQVFRYADTRRHRRLIES